MCSIRRSFPLLALMGILGLGMSVAASAQQKTSALTGVNWVPVTGTGAPTGLSCGTICTSQFYGLPYTNLANGNYYIYTGTGSVSGWQLVGASVVTLAGDVTGAAGSNTLAKIQGTTLTCSSPGTNYVPVVEGGSFVCSQLTLDQIAPAFAITGFTCSTCGASPYEAGAVVASPTNFGASYTSTPTTATISDGTNTDTLTTPFTSGSLLHSYCNASGAFSGLVTVDFRLTAVAATTKTSDQYITCTFREFGGVGTSGATGATASGTTAVLAGATGTLASAGLGQRSTWGPYSPSNQYIYVLGTGSACTFTSGGFSFLMNSPVSFSFTNQYGVAVGMYLYRSVNQQNAVTTLTGTC
jgi:hypothetical protein